MPKIDTNFYIQIRKKTQDGPALSFITGCNKQSKEIERVIRKHWPILLKDDVFNKILPSHPNFIYRKNHAIRGKLVKNIIVLPKKDVWSFGRFLQMQ